MQARINEQITSPEVRVIDPDGKQRGIMAIADALELARGLRMDLLEIAPTATPPVVRIMDVAKFREEQERRDPPPDYRNN
ncbi:MAG TPA: translation initiation factor IF-3 [Patescibacteria group bacterium]|nr:translation initiation factor IF-3 [Patescibacteria group bacterium]